MVFSSFSGYAIDPSRRSKIWAPRISGITWACQSMKLSLMSFLEMLALREPPAGARKKKKKKMRLGTPWPQETLAAVTGY
jgi:hypothetical protein